MSGKIMERPVIQGLAGPVQLTGALLPAKYAEWLEKGLKENDVAPVHECVVCGSAPEFRISLEENDQVLIIDLKCSSCGESVAAKLHRNMSNFDRESRRAPVIMAELWNHRMVARYSDRLLAIAIGSQFTTDNMRDNLDMEKSVRNSVASYATCGEGLLVVPAVVVR